MNRRRSIIGPQIDNQSSNVEENDAGYITPAAPASLLDVVDDIGLQKTMNKMNNYRINVEKIMKDAHQKEIEIKALREENQSLKTELGKMKKKLERNSQSNYPEEEIMLLQF